MRWVADNDVTGEGLVKLKNNKQMESAMVLFALGFRPFFLGAGFAGLALMVVWLWLYGMGQLRPVDYYGTLIWHGHEMLFGYVVAVIAGFLLTAVRNWTGRMTAQGPVLAALAVLWLAARLLPLFAQSIAPWLIAVVDLAFLPALILTLSIPLVRAGQPRNLVFIPLLVLMFVANLLVHLQMLGVTLTTARHGIDLMQDLVVLLIVIMGGRVIPFFTERALQGFVIQRWAVLEFLCIASVVLLLLLRLFDIYPKVQGAVAVLAFFSHATRLISWHSPRMWNVPLLWVLHLAYAWLVIGFLLQAMILFDYSWPQLARHAFTTGTMGVMTLGMMARVSLGHSGRPLQVTFPMSFAFGMINLAVLLRVIAPLLFPQWYQTLIVLSGSLWVLAFLIFVVSYFPVLTRPRIDGAPG